MENLPPSWAAQVSIWIGYGIFHMILWPGLYLFISRRHLEPIASRGWFLSLLSILSIFISLTLMAPGPADPSCFCDMIYTVTIIPTVIIPLLSRVWILLRNFSKQHSMVGRTRWIDRVITKYGMNPAREAGRTPWRRYLAGYAIYTLFSWAIGVIVYFKDEFLSQQEFVAPELFVHNRCFMRSTLPILLIHFSIMVVIAVVLILLLSRTAETYYMRIEFVLLLITGSVFFLLAVLAILIEDLFPEPYQGNFWTVVCFTLYAVIILWLPIAMSFRGAGITRKKARNSVVAGFAKEEIVDLLEDPDLASSFERYAVDSWNVENLLFLRAVSKFRSLPASQLADEAKLIQEEFLLRDAKCEINVDASLKKSVEASFASGNFSHNMFDEMEKSVSNLLWHSVLPLWLSSNYIPTAKKEELEKMRLQSLKSRTSRTSEIDV